MLRPKEGEAAAEQAGLGWCEPQRGGTQTGNGTDQALTEPDAHRRAVALATVAAMD